MPDITDNGGSTPSSLKNVLDVLHPMPLDEKLRLINAVIAFYELPIATIQRTGKQSEFDSPAASSQRISLLSPTHFSANEEVTPKEFLMMKQPETDVERVACLAYYLTHYRHLKEFNTVDINSINQEAAYAKFSNAANAVSNATAYGYLMAIGNGLKQLSAMGERYVSMLPDRDAAKSILEKMMKRKKKRVSSQ